MKCPRAVFSKTSARSRFRMSHDERGRLEMDGKSGHVMDLRAGRQSPATNESDHVTTVYVGLSNIDLRVTLKLNACLSKKWSIATSK